MPARVLRDIGRYFPPSCMRERDWPLSGVPYMKSFESKYSNICRSCMKQTLHKSGREVRAAWCMRIPCRVQSLCYPSWLLCFARENLLQLFDDLQCCETGVITELICRVGWAAAGNGRLAKRSLCRQQQRWFIAQQSKCLHAESQGAGGIHTSSSLCLLSLAPSWNIEEFSSWKLPGLQPMGHEALGRSLKLNSKYSQSLTTQKPICKRIHFVQRVLLIVLKLGYLHMIECACRVGYGWLSAP